MQTHPDVMIVVVQMLVPAAVHFGQERPSSSGVAGVHIRVKVVAQTTDYLGFVENALNRYTRRKEEKSTLPNVPSQ